MTDYVCQATEFRYLSNSFVGCCLRPDQTEIAWMEVFFSLQNYSKKSFSVRLCETTQARIKCKSHSHRNAVELSTVETRAWRSNCSFTECLIHLLADNTTAVVYVNRVGWVLLCTTRDSYEIGYGTDANIRLCSQQFVCWDNKIHWQAISTDIFQQSKVEQSGQFMTHSLIQLIFEEKDYLSVNLFVAD